jgi:RHS repeat-associated protein
LGRTIRVARGDTNSVQSCVDTVHAPCACSPLGKIQKVSQPYAPGGTPVWTTYTYDGLGRTLSIQRPDGASTTAYACSGNQTTVTDPAGSWKIFTKDVLGNLTSVVEPDPSSTSGGTLTTSYVYDWMNHVSQVSMTRAGTTQTRTFVYSDAGLLTSATNPENGTVNYYYNSDNTLQYKQDAKGQATVYTYDPTSKFVTMVQHFPQGQANAEDTCQRVTYVYGTDPTTYSYSRLISVSIAGGNGCPGYSGATLPWYGESYTYNAPGGIATKAASFGGGGASVSYTYNTAGQVSSVSYPVTGIDPHWNWGGDCDDSGDCDFPNQGVPYTLTYGFDSMGRPNSLKDNYYTSISYQDANYETPSQWPYNQTTWVQNVQYDLAGRLNSMQYLTTLSDNGNGVVTDTYTTQTKSYNTNGQLASLSYSGGVTGSIAYNYSATQNNGQITQAVDTISGETISYQYDQLKRLTSASSTPTSGSSTAAWSEAFQYDGFGNLTGKTLNGTAGPIPVNATTNQLTNAYYDANGNMTSGSGATLVYDESNRPASAVEASGGIEYFGYSPDNKQVWRLLPNGNAEYTFYGAHGEKLGVFGMALNPVLGYNTFQPLRTNIYFAGKMIWSDNVPAYQDRLGTNRANGARFYPFGDEITSTSNDREKFATYTRDSYTGLDYANQRYYASTYGRFNTPDLSGKGIKLRSPVTWNMYQYARLDPINRNDPTGNCDWGAFGASAFSATAGALTVGVAVGADIGSSGLAAVGTAGVLISGTAGAINGVAGMIGACTGISADTISAMANTGNAGGLISILVMNVTTGGNTNSASNAEVGAFLFDATTGTMSISDFATSVANPNIETTATDIANFTASVFSAASWASAFSSPSLGFVYTPPLQVSDTQDQVPYAGADSGGAPIQLIYSGEGDDNQE